jgi:hypothetical protein
MTSASKRTNGCSGKGVALDRTRLVERVPAEGRLVKPFEEKQTCEFACWLVHRKERRRSAPAPAFKEWLLEEAGLALRYLERSGAPMGGSTIEAPIYCSREARRQTFPFRRNARP